MTRYVRTLSAIVSGLMLTACAAGGAGVKPNTAASRAQFQNPACPNQTASRIARSPTDCSAFGRTYSSEDIDRTGATTTGGALRLLDPSITVHN